MRDMESLISTYLNGEASDVEVETLFAWVREKPENAADFARACALHGHLREQLCGQRQRSAEHESVNGRAGFPPASLSSTGDCRSKACLWNKAWQSRIAAVNRFLVAAVLLLMLQMSWGALTLLELCRLPAVSNAQQIDRSQEVLGWPTQQP
jgi:ferric-dicitrate binding protein FerR (iron transport regulator)